MTNILELLLNKMEQQEDDIPFHLLTEQGFNACSREERNHFLEKLDSFISYRDGSGMSLIPLFIFNDTNFLIELSEKVWRLCDEAPPILRDALKRNGFDTDKNKITKLQDDGSLALQIASDEIRENPEFWLYVGERYGHDSEAPLTQENYESFFWSLVPGPIRASQSFRDRLIEVIPLFELPRIDLHLFEYINLSRRRKELHPLELDSSLNIFTKEYCINSNFENKTTQYSEKIVFHCSFDIEKTEKDIAAEIKMFNLSSRQNKAILFDLQYTHIGIAYTKHANPNEVNKYDYYFTILLW
jgi:hypothetical protein